MASLANFTVSKLPIAFNNLTKEFTQKFSTDPKMANSDTKVTQNQSHRAKSDFIITLILNYFDHWKYYACKHVAVPAVITVDRAEITTKSIAQNMTTIAKSTKMAEKPDKSFDNRQNAE